MHDSHRGSNAASTHSFEPAFATASASSGTFADEGAALEHRFQACSVLSGGFDLHTHSSPSHIPRVVDDFTLIQEASALGMAGVMIKNHYEPTGSRALLINEINGKRLVDGNSEEEPYTGKSFIDGERTGRSCTAYGGIVLNWPVGGLNPYAVESALRLGSRMVWMPTRDAANSLTFGNMPGDFFSRPGISVLDEHGKLLPSVYEIIEIVKSHSAVLATGHLSPEESIILCEASVKQEVKTVLTHPEWQRTKLPLSVQLDLAGKGVFIEKCWLNIAESDCTADYMLQTIRSLGPERVFLTTDCGKLGFPTPAEGMVRFVSLLLEAGFTPDALHTMVASVPMALMAGS